jgi:hypothetical protein
MAPSTAVTLDLCVPSAVGMHASPLSSSSMPHPVHYPARPRYYAYAERSERRIVCACGHRFVPEAQVTNGEMRIRCRGDRRHPCDRQLLIMAIRKSAFIFFAEVTDADIRFMEREEMGPDAQIAYLQNVPPRAA